MVPPWQPDRVTFSVEGKRLGLHIDSPRGSRFACPVCGQECPGHDTVESQWRHLDFFQHAAYLHARVPRVKCPEHGVHQVPVPWARLVREHDTRQKGPANTCPTPRSPSTVSTS